MDAEQREAFDDVNKRLEQVDKRLEQVDKRFEHVDQRLEQVDKRLEQVDKRLEQVDKRLEQVDKRLQHVDKRFEQMDQRFEQMDQRFEQADRRFGKVEHRLDGLTQEVRLMGVVLGQFGEQLGGLHNAYASLHGTMDRIEQHVRAGNEQLARFMGALIRSRTEDIDRYAALDARVTALELKGER